MDELDNIASEAQQIADACRPLLAGHSPAVMAAAMLELHSTFLSGFAVDEVRESMLEMHVVAVLSLARVKAELLHSEQRETH